MVVFCVDSTCCGVLPDASSGEMRQTPTSTKKTHQVIEGFRALVEVMILVQARVENRQVHQPAGCAR